MSSIRPLATLTVLAGAFVFLYMKINETEPELPPDVDGWMIEQDVQIGSPVDAPPAFAQSIPSSAATTAPEVAPLLDSNMAAPSIETEPSAWPSQNVANTPPAAAEPPGQPSLDEKTVANNPSLPLDVPDLPPVPTLPPPVDSAPKTPVSVPTSEASAGVELPPANTPSFPTENPSPKTPETAQAQASLFSATRLAVEAALDRGELSQALLLLSDWYGDPSLSASETAEVQQLLSQLAGSVIYSTEHRLEPPYMVQAGERLEDIAKEYEVPWQLLAKINGITQPDQLQPGSQLKVVRGPFSAVVDFSKRKMTLMLDRRYAGEFTIEMDPTISVEEGHWTVSQKLLAPGSSGLGSSATVVDDRGLMLTNATGDSSQIALVRGPKSSAFREPAGRVLRLKQGDVEDVFGILSLGSQVVIQR